MSGRSRRAHLRRCNRSQDSGARSQEKEKSLKGELKSYRRLPLEILNSRLWSWALSNSYKIFALGLGVFGCAVWTAQSRTTFGASVFGFPFLSLGMALVVAASASPAFILGRIRVPGAQQIATVTFSLYLSHKMTWHSVKTYFPTLLEGSEIEAFFIYAISALIVGSLLYFFVERPFLLLRDRPAPLRVEPLAITAEPSG